MPRVALEKKTVHFDFNAYVKTHRSFVQLSADYRMANCLPRVECRDGFSISLQAAHAMHCSPRDDEGPYTEVECGYPSAAPEFILSYAEEEENPTETIYSYVPVALVEDLIDYHGGEQRG